MKTLEALILPTENRYTAEHVWVRKDGETYLAGVSDFAQDQLGEVVFVDLPFEGAHVKANESFGDVESMKAVNKLFMPISGTIVSINTVLDETPTLVNISCYTDAWMIRIEPDAVADIEGLLSVEEYKELLG